MALFTGARSKAASFALGLSSLAIMPAMAGTNMGANAPASLPAPLPAQDGYDVITVIGTRAVSEIPGSVTMISGADLAKENYTDINRVLRVVPGINLQEEDGYGLRPNIGLRGSGTDRSSKVQIMEDGVPMAPAPFSAPAAYYFPVVGRMSGVEITKSAGAVKYGPVTTAGTVQFFSTPIPDVPAGKARIMLSDQDRALGHFWVGGRWQTQAPFEVGFLLETFQDRAEGFKTLDVGQTGFEIADYVAKLGFYSKPSALREQSLVFKIQRSDETADETYLGLTQADFNTNPYMRYRASQKDQLRAKHETYQALYNGELGAQSSITLLAYRTEFSRNWEKLDRFDNSALSGSAACNSLGEILNTPTLCAQELEVLVGADGFVSPDDVLGIRQNKRDYFAQGVQIALAHEIETGTLNHALTFSARLHEDGVDRFQEQDQYRIDNGVLVKTTDNPPGSQSNRLSQALARSAYVEDVMSFGAWQVTAGLRYGRIETEQRRWNTPDRSPAPDSVRDNAHDILLPSLGAVYDFGNGFTLLGNVTKGFAPPGPSSRASDGTEPEESVVYELGGRYDGNGLALEAIGFLTDYSNLLAECTNSSGGSECVIGDTENAGKAQVYGLELIAKKDFQLDNGLTVPFSLVYSYTKTELQSTVSNSIFGTVMAGDEIPYVPEHQLTLAGGLTGDRWGFDLSANYVSETRDSPGQGAIPDNERIEGRTIVDSALYYDIKDNLRLHLKADNIFDKTYLAARRPYGLRPGKPREVFVGVSFEF